MSDKGIEDRVVIITGAGGGMGSAMTLGLAKKGARVLAVDVDPSSVDALARTAAKNGRKGAVIPMTADVTQQEECRKILEQAEIQIDENETQQKA